VIAAYGYEDGSGTYYISIDTDKCSNCKDRGCLNGCPAGIFELEMDDWEDEIAVVKKCERNRINDICAACKPVSNRPQLLPCQAACLLQAIDHSW